MKPTVGRIVIYRMSDNLLDTGREHPAIITRAHSDTCVNLHVFHDADPVQYSVTSLLHESVAGPVRNLKPRSPVALFS